MAMELHPNRMKNITFEEIVARDLAVLRQKNFVVPDHEPPFLETSTEDSSSRHHHTNQSSSSSRRRLEAMFPPSQGGGGRGRGGGGRFRKNWGGPIPETTAGSHHHHHDQKREEDDAWKHDNYLFRSMYAEQLVPWLEYYTLDHSNNKNNLFVTYYERFVQNPQQVMNDILHFLQIAPQTYSQSILNLSYSPNDHIRAAKYKKHQQQKRLTRNKNMMNNNATAATGPSTTTIPHGEREEIEDDLDEGDVPPPRVPTELLTLRPETREYLLRFFEPYNEKLAVLLKDDQWKEIWKR